MTGATQSSSALLDCLIVGGGPAGLTAATYMARFLRSVQVIDGGAPRLSWIPKSHNYPGVPEGIHGNDALRHMQQQVALYNVPITNAHVQQLQKQADGSFRALLDNGGQVRAQKILLATGVVDIEPDFAGVKQALEHGVLRYCPICDGYEARNKKTVVMGVSKGGLKEALFVRHYTRQITLLTLGATMNLTPQEREKLEKAEIRVIDDPVVDIRYLENQRAIQLRLSNGQEETFEAMYGALGTKVNSELARQLGARLDEDDKVDVDPHMQTTVPGLYAAGDLVVGLNQIAVAMGQAAIAATAIHNSLDAWHN